MVEAGGVESHSRENQILSNKGQVLSADGQNLPQPAVDEKDTGSVNIEGGTKPNLQETSSGHPKTTSGAQQEHNRNITELPENKDLKRIYEVWDNLPEAMRQGILAMIEAAIKKIHSDPL
ncbi:MAG TPA: hypothetical protein DCZ94_20460 [Lentisphaeria bacterium]|nr:hypothetical protein [Lentisphaeria bacterium]